MDACARPHGQPAAILASIERGRSAGAVGLQSSVVTLSLRRAGDRVIAGNLLIREDGPRGLRAARRGEMTALIQLFTMKPCQ